MKYLPFISVASLSALLAGCGGGGVGVDVSYQPPPPPVQTVQVPFQKAFGQIANVGLGGSFTVSGWVNDSSPGNPLPDYSVTGSGTLILSPATAVSFSSGPLAGVIALQQPESISGNLAINGQITPFSTSEDLWYNPADFSILGLSDGSSDFYFGPYSPPALVQAGDSGTLANGITYSVATDGPTTLVVTITTSQFTSGTLSAQTEAVYRMDIFGNVSFVSDSSQLYANGFEYSDLTFTF